VSGPGRAEGLTVITLTTDFGLRDSYVAEMKGAILGVARDVQLIDITHDVAAHDVTEAALALEAAVPYFPPRTIHVAVVDPGVGTARRGLVLEAGGCCFVGPDNGLFTPFFVDGWRAFELRAAEYRLRHVSRTFHGRDVFGPAAAHLACGVTPEAFGPEVTDPVTLRWPGPSDVAGGLVGEVVHVDRFGNLVTSIPAGAVAAGGDGFAVRVAGQWLPLVATYGDLPRGEAGALVGSRSRLEVAVREGSAARALGARRGTAVFLRRGRGATSTASKTTKTTRTRRRT
jgi:S-adenosylmethionine hydrolase